MLHVYQAYLDNYDIAVTTYERLTRYQPFKKFIDVGYYLFLFFFPQPLKYTQAFSFCFIFFPFFGGGG